MNFRWIVLVEIAVISVSLSQDREFFRLEISGNIDFVVKNPDGKRSGFDPLVNRKYVEINDSYGVFSIDSEDPEIDAPSPVNEFMDDEPISGAYKVTLFGMKPSLYRISVSMSRTIKDGHLVESRGVIDSNQVIEYALQYDRSPGRPYIVERVIEGRTLRKDLDNCYKLQLLGAKPLYVDLSHRLEKYEEWIQKGDTAKARQELEKLSKKLDEVYEKSKGPSKDLNHFIKEEAYRILKEDVGGLK